MNLPIRIALPLDGGGLGEGDAGLDFLLTMFHHSADRKFIARCLELARLGLGWVSPNPLVGAVIVKHGRVIGEGYHAAVGQTHAEVAALQGASESVSGATLYVNLEPCNHQGRTPPCTDAIIAAGIHRVVIGMRDPNPHVRGGGIRRLKRAGIRVTVGVMRDECRGLNRIFSNWVTTGRPYIVAKAAIGCDYKIAAAPGVRTQITGLEAQAKVHELRQMYDAILVGSGTVSADNPELSVRYYPNRPRDPRRIILDSQLRLALGANVLRDHNVLVATTKNADPQKLASLRQAQIPVLVTASDEGHVNLSEVLDWCRQNGITSILVEGGRNIFDRFTRESLIDRWYIFVGPRPLGHGGVDALTDLAPIKRCIGRVKPQFFGQDVLYEFTARS